MYRQKTYLFLRSHSEHLSSISSIPNSPLKEEEKNSSIQNNEEHVPASKTESEAISNESFSLNGSSTALPDLKSSSNTPSMCKGENMQPGSVEIGAKDPSIGISKEYLT